MRLDVRVDGEASHRPYPTKDRTLWRRVSREHAALIAVSLLFTITALARTSQSLALWWDEAVYVSQVTPDVPVAPFSAHRSRGVSMLVSPVAAVTSSPLAIRVYLTLLSGVFLYLAFRPWLRVCSSDAGVRRYVPAMAAAFFGSLWITIMLAMQALPNLWVAFALVGGIGLVCRPVGRPNGRGAVDWWVLLAFAGASLLRPTDALIAAAPVVALLLTPGWRRVGALLSVISGLAVGWIAWAAEALVRFGDPLSRLRTGADSVGSGFTWNLPQHLETIRGPCLTPPLCGGEHWWTVAWWVAIPVLVVFGLIGARKFGTMTPTALAAACGACAVGPYIVMVNVWQDPRFLVPAYALVAPAVASGLLWIAGRRRVLARAVAVSVVSALVLGHVLVQQEVVGRAHGYFALHAERNVPHADHLQTVERVDAPCLVSGDQAIQLAYLLRCRALVASIQTLPDHEADLDTAIERGDSVIIRLREDAPPPPFMADWRLVPLPGDGPLVAYLPS